MKFNRFPSFLNSPLLTAFFGLLLTTGVMSAFEFRVVSWEGTVTDLYFETSGQKTYLYAGEGALSPRYETRGSSLSLYRDIQTEEGLVQQEVANMTIPEASSRAILVLAATDHSQQRYTGLWIEDLGHEQPANTVRFKNLSSHTVAIQSNGENITIPRQESILIEFPPGARSIPLRMAAQTQEGWTIVAATRHPVSTEHRALVLLRDGRKVQNDYDDRPPRIIDVVTLVDTTRQNEEVASEKRISSQLAQSANTPPLYK